MTSNPQQLPCWQCMPDPRRKQNRSDNDGNEDDGNEDDGDEDELYPSASTPIESRRKRAKTYDPFSQEPTPLALMHQKRKKNGQ